MQEGDDTRTLVYRHPIWVRVTHWVNAFCLPLMFMSGLQIFNAHPALYWGAVSDFAHPFIAMFGLQDHAGHVIAGVTQIGHWQLDTTGFLGASDEDGRLTARGFPDWVTIPGPQWLAMGRLWHFFFAWIFVLNGLAFVACALIRRHAQDDLLPSGMELRHLGREVVDHLRLRFPQGEAARHYNVLQKLAYVAVIFVLGPLVVLTGLTMSPTMDSVAPWLLWLFGGRQSARTIHFFCAFCFLAFFVVHIAMVVLSGTRNNIRSMITGWYAVRPDTGDTLHG
jgi:thiosulfate reductase cytochrome b subunit